MELIDSNHQWNEVQRRQTDSGFSAVQQASVMKSSMATSKHQSNDTDSHGSSNHRGRRHKKNRLVNCAARWIHFEQILTKQCTKSSSRSPSEGPGRSRIWSSELAKHLQFDLVDTAGMTEDQLREIPYTVVEMQTSKQRSASSNSLKVHKNHTKDRVDRIRGYVRDTPEPLGDTERDSLRCRIYLTDKNGTEPTVNGSIRSASTLSSRDCDRNTSLVR